MHILTHCPKRVKYFLKFSSPFLSRLVRKKKFGRHGYDYTEIFKYLLIKQTCNLTYRDLEETTGIHNSTLVKVRKTFRDKQVYQKFFRHLVKELIKLGKLKAKYVALDGSFVETYSKKKEAGSSYWGKVEKEGFKLHVLVDATTEVPLALEITKGSTHDSKLLIPLCSKLASYKLKANYVIADKAYDSDDLVSFVVKKLGALASIPVKNRRKQNDLNLEYKLKGRTEDKVIYKKRTSVERVFSYLKEKFNLGTEKMRGIQNFKVNCFLSLICLLLDKFQGWRISKL